MSKPKLKFAREVMELAKELGIQNVRLGRTKDHQLLLGEFDGRPIRYIFPGVSSARYIKTATRVQLRRLITAKAT